MNLPSARKAQEATVPSLPEDAGASHFEVKCFACTLQRTSFECFAQPYLNTNKQINKIQIYTLTPFIH